MYIHIKSHTHTVSDGFLLVLGNLAGWSLVQSSLCWRPDPDGRLGVVANRNFEAGEKQTASFNGCNNSFNMFQHRFQSTWEANRFGIWFFNQISTWNCSLKR